MDRRDRKYLNKNGSFDLEAAMAAGRNARARDLAEGWRIVIGAAVRLVPTAWRAFAALCSRFSFARASHSKAT